MKQTQPAVFIRVTLLVVAVLLLVGAAALRMAVQTVPAGTVQQPHVASIAQTRE